ncbi:VanZ family protein [Paenibacillus sp. N1-5-1-14]|uniref:VanZ family protein n=1 Tax=Paenibacillus radicibacter TaxID=2972488 RepID=UPI0021596857|nr:VanZ family protein [Paenibacillus radicibacter]MCR8643825.1 VanZ family protein [Paenibacillus radicibacter]
MTFYRKHRTKIWLVLAIVWMGFIFYKSAEPYHEQDMRPKLAEYVSESTLNNILPKVEFYYNHGIVTYKKPYDMLEFFIRKLGHISEYALLTYIFIKLFLLLFNNRSTLFVLFLSAILAIGYAASDEWHQTFVEGRSGLVVDVGMDAIGVLLVTVIYGFCLWFKSKKAASLS